jgi:hypothetical protein
MIPLKLQNVYVWHIPTCILPKITLVITKTAEHCCQVKIVPSYIYAMVVEKLKKINQNYAKIKHMKNNV